MKIRVILEVEVVHGESFRGIFTVFLKTKSEHWAVETFKGVSEEESKFAFCFCLREIGKRQLEKKSCFNPLF